MRVELKVPAWAEFLLSDLTDWNRTPVPVAEVAPFDLPDDVYFEYTWQDASGRKRPDPANTNPRRNPWWPHACNLTGPDYRPEPWSVRADGPPRGRTLRLMVESGILGESRPLLVYTPAGCADRALPLVVFQDGKAYYAWGRAPRILDVMLEAGEIGPAHLVFIPPRKRTQEYAFNQRYRRFICEEALPLAMGRVRCSGRAVAWGASLGGLLSAELAWERPDIFGCVVAQSGAFQFSPDMDFDHPFGGSEAFLHKVRAASDLPALRWRLQCGTLEWLLDSNRNLHRELDARGADCKLDLRHAGHNWVNWLEGMAAGFRFALGI